MVPVRTYDHATSGGFYAWAWIFDSRLLYADHQEKKREPLASTEFVKKLIEHGISATNADRYPLLHTLPLFQGNFDLFGDHRSPLLTTDKGGHYTTPNRADFPNAEAIWPRIVFLPVLSDPINGAAETMATVIREAVDDYKKSLGIQVSNDEKKATHVESEKKKTEFNTVVIGYGMAGKGFHCYLVNIAKGLKLYGVMAAREDGQPFLYVCLLLMVLVVFVQSKSRSRPITRV